MVWLMASGPIRTELVPVMKATGSLTCSMGMELRTGTMALSSRDNIKKVKSMGAVH